MILAVILMDKTHASRESYMGVSIVRG